MSEKKQPNDLELDTSLVQDAPPEALAALQEMVDAEGGPTAFAHKLAAMAAALEASGEQTVRVGDMTVGRVNGPRPERGRKGAVRVVGVQEVAAEDQAPDSAE